MTVEPIAVVSVIKHGGSLAATIPIEVVRFENIKPGYRMIWERFESFDETGIISQYRVSFVKG